MKLRNKKTGFVTNWCIDKDVIRTCDGKIIYNSLAELNADWEDVPEEPLEYWYIDIDGVVAVNAWDLEDDIVKGMRTIGNYFGTREEAKKAVEKLKAWKRLKDKGFEFEGIAGITNEIYFKSNEEFNYIMVDEYTADKTEKEYIDDLMLLFGGEND